DADRYRRLGGLRAVLRHPNDADTHLGAVIHPLEIVAQIQHRADWTVVQLVDHVAGTDARALRRAAAGHLHNLDRHLLLDVELAAERLRQHARLCGDAQDGATYDAVFHQPGGDPVDGVHRDGERETLRLLDDGDVDADDLALRVDQRATGVARVDGGVGLDDVLDHLAAIARKGAMERADDADGDGALQADRAANRDDKLTHLEPVGVAQLRRR